MANDDIDATVKRFQVLAVRSAVGEEVKADLPRLVREAGKTAQATVPTAWHDKVRLVRGRLRVVLHTLETPEPDLPDKLADPANQAQRVFYADAIAQFSTLIEGGE